MQRSLYIFTARRSPLTLDLGAGLQIPQWSGRQLSHCVGQRLETEDIPVARRPEYLSEALQLQVEPYPRLVIEIALEQPQRRVVTGGPSVEYRS